MDRPASGAAAPGLTAAAARGLGQATGRISLARQFIADITPYFHARPIVYVDGGAHTGKILASLAESGLDLREAHLIEPNPRSFAALGRTVERLAGRIHRARLHNLALGAAPGRLRMTDAGSMSRVLGPAVATEAEAAVAEGGFEVDCVTLDSLAWDFEDGRVSILKLDVEGFEPEALRGAAGLLSRQAIDVIYLEAGLAAGSLQQSYYRTLEDLLAGHGYRVFGVYEQTHEWPSDSPLLRRVNLGFMSERFAAANPHRLSRELYRLRIQSAALVTQKDALAAEAEDLRGQVAARSAEIEALRAEAAARGQAVAEAVAAASAANAALTAAQTALAALTRDVAAAERQAGEARTEREALAREHARILDYARALEKRYADTLASTTWRALEPARWLSRRIKRRNPPTVFTPRLGAETVASGNADAGREEAQGGALALRLDDKLWGGFSAAALPEIQALANDHGRPNPQRLEAFFALARWSHSHGDMEAALAAVRSMRKLDKRKSGVMRAVLLEADCLIRLDRAEEARALLEEAQSRRPQNGDLHLALANCLLGPDGAAPQGADAVRLDRINRIYAGAGLAPLKPHDPLRPLGIDNLATLPVAPEGDPADLPRISVIMPVYAAAETLGFALRGLLAQSWGNLEVIVADDCSPDDTVAVAEAVAARDPRVKVVRQTENRGSYAARNAALKAVTGDFVTTHDADDWSHPQKLATQARFMAENPDVQGCFSDWVRVAPNMRAGWLFRPWGGYSSKNMSSIFLRRAAMEALGGWDPVRVGGDTDLLRRAEAIFGKEAVQRVRPGVPLAFALHAERSLTRASATHVRTMLHGVRREYDEAGAFWRQTLRDRAAAGDLKALAALRFPPDAAGPRPFPAPALILGEPAQGYDLVFVSDFALKGGAFVSTLNAIEAATRAGLSVGVVHWRRYDLDVTQELNPALRRLAQAGAVRVIAPGEAARAGTVIVGYPAVLRTPMDLFPRIEAGQLVVVVNQMAERLYSGKDPQYDPRDLRAHLRETFGTEGLWAPISGLVQRLMRADPRYPVPTETIWTPLADAAAWCATSPRWRGAGGRAPVVGRHARDHYTKWPTTREALRAAYCADRPCAVEIMGGAARALAVMGSQPANWTVHPFGAMDARTFLGRLDAFVHYPHEDYIEEFGRAALEAIALGLPAVLPPVFRQSFGAAALYAEPGDVWDTISALWADEAAWLAQGKAGQDFVRANSDWSLFPARLKATLAEADPPPAEAGPARVAPAAAPARADRIAVAAGQT